MNDAVLSSQESGRGTAVIDSVKTEAGKVKSAVLREADDTGTKLKQEAKAAVGSLRETGARYAASQMEILAQKAGEYAGAASAAADRLREGEKTGETNLLAGPAEAAAGQLSRLSRYLRDSDPAEIMRGINDLARRKPELFFGGLFLAGLIGARFLKASGKREPVNATPSWEDPQNAS